MAGHHVPLPSDVQGMTCFIEALFGRSSQERERVKVGQREVMIRQSASHNFSSCHKAVKGPMVRSTSASRARLPNRSEMMCCRHVGSTREGERASERVHIAGGSRVAFLISFSPSLIASTRREAIHRRCEFSVDTRLTWNIRWLMMRKSQRAGKYSGPTHDDFVT